MLGSRKPRAVDPDAWWLRTTFALAAHLAREGHRLCTSSGNLSYEAALYGAARHGGRILAFVASSQLPSLVDCLPPQFPSDRLEVCPLPDADGPARDRAVIDAADLCIAVAVRPGGSMVNRLIARWRRGRPVQVVPPPLRPGRTGHGSSRARVDPVVGGNLELMAAGVPPLAGAFSAPCPLPVPASPSATPAFPGTFVRWEDDPILEPTLAHYTRAAHGPWPGQPRWGYLEDLYHGGPRGRRDARSTLAHILEERRIRASRRLIRGRHPVVSFTEHKPEAVARLHRYRRHLVRWDFQPYGLVFIRRWLEQSGARPVRYLPASAFDALPEEDRPWFQKHEPPGCDYSAEREWRVLGDVDLAAVPPGAVRVVWPRE